MKNKLMWLGLSLALAMAFLLCTVTILTAEEVMAAAAAPADILTVCKDGPPICDFSVVQTAVDSAAPNDVIKVAAGVYSDLNSYAGLAQVIYISRAITIQGGYTPAFDEPPDPENNPTVIDAQGLGRSIAIITSPDVDVVLAGLQITGGDATGLGGLVATDIGGGILSIYANLTLSHSLVFSNTDNREISFASRGGGIFIGAGSAQILDTVILDNSGDYGGGISAYVTHLLLNNSQIVNNEGGAGGGIFLQDTEAEFNGNLIQNNLASAADNSGIGGGIFVYYSTLTSTNNLILANVTNGLGGGVMTANANFTMTNDVIADNQAALNAGGLYLSGSTGQLIHSTIANNGREGLVAAVSMTSPTTESHIVLTNTIVAGHNSTAIVAVPDSTAILYNTLWHNNIIDYEGNLTTTANFTGDPAFIDPNNGNYHITATSAALNVGAVTGVLLDIDGESRLVGPAPDLGADEWPLPPENTPIEGLTAVNDSPTPLGNLTTLTAIVSGMNNVSYTWDFGDGSQETGAVVTHEYEQVGVYTAVVTATNFTNTLTATTTVTVTDVALAGLTAVNSSPTELGTATFLTATITAGTNVSYTWDLGDGTVGHGRLLSHPYSLTGTYTAVVTATNSVNTVTATTLVVIAASLPAPGFTLYLPFVAQPTAMEYKAVNTVPHS